jgi:three-Cys-motif partner protein
MPKSADHFDEEFAPHSRHKHLIFRSYFEAWVRKLTLRPEGGDRLCVVDACAGAGHDAVGNPGSPLIAARAAKAAVEQFRDQFHRDVRVDVIAIESEPRHFKELSAYLSTFPNTVRPMLGTLEQHQAQLEGEFGETPTLYFVDPFGLAPLKAHLIQRAIDGPRNEVFLLFADQAALRHFGAIEAEETQAMRKLRVHKERPPSLFPYMDEQEREPLAEKAA